jgi:hypothetical protein
MTYFKLIAKRFVIDYKKGMWISYDQWQSPFTKSLLLNYNGTLKRQTSFFLHIITISY